MTADPASGRPTPAAIWAALVTVYIVWGSTYLAIRVVVGSAPPLVAMGARFLVAAVLLAGLLRWRRGAGSLRLASWRQLAATATLGLLLLLGGNGLVAVAEERVPSGLTALLIAATPLWLVVMRSLAADRPRPMTLVGTLVGFAGLVVLVQPRGLASGVPLGGVLVALVASLSWATGSFVPRWLPLPADSAVVTVYEMLTGGAVMVVLGAARGELDGFRLGAVSGRAWLALAYLVVFGSILAFSAYVWLIANAPISLTATYAYVNPVVAVGLGSLLLGEAVTPAMLLGGAVVVLGVAIVVATERPRRTRVPARSEHPTAEANA